MNDSKNMMHTTNYAADFSFICYFMNVFFLKRSNGMCYNNVVSIKEKMSNKTWFSTSHYMIRNPLLMKRSKN